MTRRTLWRPLAATLLIAAALVALRGSAPAVARQEATPTPYSCDAAPPMAGSPMAGMDMGSPMAGMDMGSPMAGMDMSQAVELDQLYIDMMIPHHASIIALAEAALPRLTDQRLQSIAQNIVDAQTAEIAELRGYREQRYGSPDAMPMDARMMDMTMRAMPGMGSMEEMAFQMDAANQVAAFCAAENPDLTFIDMVTAHHEMAIASSTPVVERGINEEIRAFAQRVIDDQQREIAELTTIRAELTGEATPTS